VLWLLLACGTDPVVAPPLSEDLDAHCRDAIGPPRVQDLGQGIRVAIGYDLANTILIETSAGNVVVDVSQSPARARQVRAALDPQGPIVAVVLTHSHIDHVGGASVWVEEGTQVWATDAFNEHFLKQYGVFLPAERDRAARQFGMDVPMDALPCHALGARMDLNAALHSGVSLPTHTFSDAHTLVVGDTTLELVEAHGETHDQLFVYLPHARALLPGDNWYRAFPNLYTVRGSAPRDVRAWIASIDAMRALEPELLIPSHTAPVVGADAVQHELTVYRDAMQALRDGVIRSANAGVDLDTIARTVVLPPALASEPSLQELYGEVGWSVRAMYTNELGWFDGDPTHLYPPDDVAWRTVELMGGAEVVRAEAERALAADDPAWALHLLGLLRDAGERVELSAALTALAAQTANTNGRAYLLQTALEESGDASTLGEPVLPDSFVEQIPLDLIFEVMASKVRADPDVHESLVVDLGDERVVLTVRNGICEVSAVRLPGTPEPVATVVVSAEDWRRLALRKVDDHDVHVDVDNPLAFARFMARFR
jgi:alkyl sulfatase BDS1-like metallo-beta-lactamase superfamily hydrolase